jgi:hypothetical protein
LLQYAASQFTLVERFEKYDLVAGKAAAGASGNEYDWQTRTIGAQQVGDARAAAGSQVKIRYHQIDFHPPQHGGDGMFLAASLEHDVVQRSEHCREMSPYQRLVFDDKEGRVTMFGGIDLRVGRLNVFASHARSRKIQGYCRAGAESALDFDPTPRLLRELERRRQAQTRAFPFRFCREERLASPG